MPLSPLPRSYPIRLLCSQAVSAQAHDQAGQARHALAQDPRIAFTVCAPGADCAGGDPAWGHGLQELAEGRLQALVWMAPELVVHDFLLADRLSEWRAQGIEHLSARHQGREVFRAQLVAQPKQAPTGADERIALSVDGQVLQATPWDQRPPLLLVCATRTPAEDFYTRTALGRSVQRLRAAGVQLRVRAACANRRPLAEVYNSAIEPAFANHILVFVHDDVRIDDHHIALRLDQALDCFDLVGLAGTCQRESGQPAWLFPWRVGHWDHRERLRGCVGHDTTTHPAARRKVRMVNHFGPSHSPAELLDGVLLAARGSTLLQHPLRFDPALAFDFYDMDFCRQATQLQLRPGVWPMAITHFSGGNFDSPSWRRSYPIYLDKWGEKPPKPQP